MGTTTGCASFIIIDKSTVTFQMPDRPNHARDMNSQLSGPVNRNASQPPATAMKTWRNPVNSGYKSRAAPWDANRAPYPDQKIDMPGRRSEDKRWRSRSPGINTEDAMPEATALRRDHEETALIAVQKNCRALFEQQSHRAAG